MNLNYLAYGLLIAPTILVVAGVIWCYLIANDYI
jgi:hypothetical protein